MLHLPFYRDDNIFDYIHVISEYPLFTAISYAKGYYFYQNGNILIFH